MSPKIRSHLSLPIDVLFRLTLITLPARVYLYHLWQWERSSDQNPDGWVWVSTKTICRMVDCLDSSAKPDDSRLRKIRRHLVKAGWLIEADHSSPAVPTGKKYRVNEAAIPAIDADGLAAFNAVHGKAILWTSMHTEDADVRAQTNQRLLASNLSARLPKVWPLTSDASKVGDAGPAVHAAHPKIWDEIAWLWSTYPTFWSMRDQATLDFWTKWWPAAVKANAGLGDVPEDVRDMVALVALARWAKAKTNPKSQRLPALGTAIKTYISEPPLGTPRGTVRPSILDRVVADVAEVRALVGALEAAGVRSLSQIIEDHREAEDAESDEDAA